ncbi:MAG: transposase family protein, partial [Chloroflexi bacterium]|nr:transposase family protein [Chloroflexota bacterium]
MSKPSRRPNREEIKRQRKEVKKAEKQLRQKMKEKGLVAQPDFSVSNRKSPYESVKEETQARLEAVTEEARVFKVNLPVLLKRLSRIPDPRNPKKTKHKLTVLMLYGILVFVYQMSSRREANEKMTNPIIIENLKLLFPELESMPHSDTLERLLARIDVNQIETAQIELVRRLIRKKKFARYLIQGRYPIAIDGTQKMVRDYLWSEECLERKIKVKK